VKTLNYSIPPSSFCTRQSPTVSCLETGSLSNARNTKQKFMTTRALNVSNTYYFSTHCWVVRRRGAMRDLRAVRLIVRAHATLPAFPCLAQTLLAHRRPAAPLAHIRAGQRMYTIRVEYAWTYFIYKNTY